MSDATERLLNLAMYMSEAGPVTAEECRAEVAGYPDEQDDSAFARMFERDKDALRSFGVVIRVVDEETESYAVDEGMTFVSDVGLDEHARAALRAAGAALLAEDDFPLASALRRALLKLGGREALAAGPVDRPHVGRHTSDRPVDALADALADAVDRRKIARFSYARPGAEPGERAVEPYGLFLRAGSWYLVARDIDKGAMRTFALSRMSGLVVEPTRPKTPDFERPADFDVTVHLRLPFQYGEETIEATIRIDPEHAWRLDTLTGGRGHASPQEDGSVLWDVTVRDPDRLSRWLVEQGPGLVPVAPGRLVDRLASGLRRVVRTHGG